MTYTIQARVNLNSKIGLESEKNQNAFLFSDSVPIYLEKLSLCFYLNSYEIFRMNLAIFAF